MIECVPNFSEGRNLSVVNEIVAAAKSGGAKVLDVNSDPDHNRSVLTFAGEEEKVFESAFQSIKKASQLIDLRKHQGVHPRIGAADVIPFIPMAGNSMDDCIRLAERLGARVSEELNIPVYLYGKAAQRLECVNLSDIRRGGYEELIKAIEDDPLRKPDFGPEKLGPAGASAIGARDFLIAFNIYLVSDDIPSAKKIARKIRESSGGLKCVKALGLEVAHHAQVSMNLTDYRVTPIDVVFNAVKAYAEEEGQKIWKSELIGLAPAAAFSTISPSKILLSDFTDRKIIENVL